MARTSRVETLRTTALACGIVSSILYGGMIAFIRYDGYSAISQVPSELTAIGAPTASLWAVLGAVYDVLIALFGWGVWKSTHQHRTLRRVGALLVASASLGLLWPFGAMHQREVIAAGGGTTSDSIHLALGGVTVVLMFITMGVASRAFGTRFRVYTLASIVMLVTFGMLTFREAPRLSQNLPTPWIGLWERIDISVFLLWVIVLAVVTWPTRATCSRRSRADEARVLK